MRERARTHEQASDDEGDLKSSDTQEIFSPGQNKKSEFKPKASLFGFLNAGNMSKALKLVAEVGTSIGNIVAPIPDDEDLPIFDTEEETDDGELTHEQNITNSSVERSIDDIKYKQESKERLAALALVPESPTTSSTSASLDEIDLSMSPRSPPVGSVNRGSFSPPPFTLSSALLSAASNDQTQPLPALKIAATIPKTTPPSAVTTLIANQELEKCVQTKYRETMENAVQEQSAELQSMRLLNSRLVEDQHSLEKRIADKNEEIAKLRRELQQAEQQSKISESTPDQVHHGDASEIQSLKARLQSTTEREAALRLELEKLSAALTEGEDALKSTEEIAWKAKAEAAELLYALELEQEKSMKINAAGSELRRELEIAAGKMKGLENERDAALCTLAAANTAGLSASPLEKISGEDMELTQSKEQVRHLAELNGSLQLELSESKALLDGLRAALQTSTDSLKAAETVKTSLSKSEKECQQLQVVIKQLQQRQKGSREDIDAITAERDALKAQVEELSSDSEELSRITSQNLSAVSKVDALESAMDASKKRIAFLEAAYDESKRRVAELEKQNYDLNDKQMAAGTDMLLLQQELNQRQQETENLHNTLASLQREHSVWKLRNQDEIERKMDALRKENDAVIIDIEASWQQKMIEKDELIRLGNQRYQDETLHRRKAEIDLNTEKRRMKKTLDETLSQLHNSQENVVDRALIANLIVSYFKRGRSLDVLQLVSKVLGFTDEQKQIVGLMVPPINLIGTLYTTIVGGPPKLIDVEGDNLAELWANFLEMEAQEAIEGVSVMAKPKPPIIMPSISVPSSPVPASVSSASAPAPTPAPVQKELAFTPAFYAKSPHQIPRPPPMP